MRRICYITKKKKEPGRVKSNGNYVTLRNILDDEYLSVRWDMILYSSSVEIVLLMIRVELVYFYP